MCRNLGFHRSITKSHEHHRSSVLLDGSQYIQELKRKLEKLGQAVLDKAHDMIDFDPMPMKVTVEEQEKGFLIRVLSRRSCHGLLTFILEAFEELGLDVLSARATCVDGFCLEALGVKDEDEEAACDDIMDEQVVQRTVFRAIQNWRQLRTNDPASS
ncbi:uncharacterized protein LOC129301805 [Prosopis cineraria]|uniref:uncharacterized protein LOC129301805 n=1 Tax=Prosopis cineraria TaxID=364024 RepID=UPI0024108F22|nr:uncharacterized protein LOC129301805 [Prosopis cineraria]